MLVMFLIHLFLEIIVGKWALSLEMSDFARICRFDHGKFCLEHTLFKIK